MESTLKPFAEVQLSNFCCSNTDRDLQPWGFMFFFVIF